ncbi:guanine nucleotide-binding protein alpha subunit [Scheffersomyces xylosifermentans]|uniref:guanine nucleotide-binding protein alpha subunit n=1 Tax=Scheffersomyces xylosifermentans TaxID=1304137 RepID=UPI00315D6451
MGCAASVPESDENDPFLQDKRINDAIEQGLQLTKQNEKNQIKLLLLGAGESGKSTVLKQMKLLHKGGFTQQERIQYSQVIWCDVIQSMKILIIQARKLGISLECDMEGNPLIPYKQIILRANALDQIDTGAAGGANFLNDYVLKYSEHNKNRRRLNSTGVANTSFWDNDNTPNRHEDDGTEDFNNFYNSTPPEGRNYPRIQIAEAISKLWSSDSGIRACYERSNEFQFEASADYYFDNVYKFADPNYFCTDMDILKGRIKTTGITETNFNINSFKFKVLDAGGQRSERKKWIHCFDNITAVLFVLAVSEYDQMLFEDERVNRMHESIVLFDSLCNSKWFANTPFILFLNKVDIFEKKLEKSPLKDYFPDFNGKPNDVESAIKFFETNFLKLNKTNKPIYVHRTCATDTQSMKFVLSAVTDMIIQQNLKKSGIM